MFYIYAEPKNGAQSGPHYIDSGLGDVKRLSFPSRDEADEYRKDEHPDNEYWSFSVREA